MIANLIGIFTFFYKASALIWLNFFFFFRIVGKGISTSQKVVNESRKRKLLHWLETKEIVAEDEITSIDPNALVHHMTLGPNC